MKQNTERLTIAKFENAEHCDAMLRRFGDEELPEREIVSFHADENGGFYKVKA